MYHRALSAPVIIALLLSSSLVVSDDLVWRDQFYDGHPRKERGVSNDTFCGMSTQCLQVI